MQLLLLSALLPAVFAAPAAPAANSSKPSVTIHDGTLIGQSANGIDTFLGVPFAQPPVGNLRLRAPQPILKPYGTKEVINAPPACPQQNLSLTSLDGLPDSTKSALQGLFGSPPPQSEDCLTLDISRPAGVKADAKLPVLFWILGGGWEIGTSQSYPADGVLNTSVSKGEPVIYVAVNYRVNGFGFLGGREVQREHLGNLGLRDQRMGLQWVADNIAAFGGDPSRVTIWGESAGSVSVYDQLLINGGDNHYKGKPLFRGAIMNSGTAFRVDPIDAPQAQTVFDNVVAAAGCKGKGPALDCLRAAPFDKLQAAFNSQPDFVGPRSLALSYTTRSDPTDPFYCETREGALTSGKFAKVPVVMTDLEDEGPLFSLGDRSINTTADLTKYIGSLYPNTPKSLVEKLVASYPDDPAAGSPFRTGKDNVLYPQFKRVAAILGDTFTLTRRQALETFSREVKAWSYLGSWAYGALPYLGTYHTIDLGYEYFGLQPAEIGTQLLTFAVNFANHLDPNGKDKPTWPQWEPATKQVLNISASGLSTLKDDFRQKNYDVLVQNPHSFRF